MIEIDIQALGDILGLIAKIIAALGTIGGVFVAIFKYGKKIMTSIKDVMTKLDSMEKELKAQRLSILRLVVYNDHLPLSERIIAGKEYIESDGNGDVKRFIESELLPFDTTDRKE